MNDKTGDYVLGVNSAEIDRLALQHRVWRERTLGLWRRAGLRRGAAVLDVGCGPGWAAIDLAEIVGPKGRVLAIDRAPAYVAHARRLAEERGLGWLDARNVNLPDAIPVGEPVDFAWVRWVLAFTPDRGASLAAIASALRPGGMLTIQEYVHYQTWSLLPESAPFSRFVDAVVESWRADGGEPDAAKELPDLLDAAGFDLVAVDAFVDVVGPGEPMWDWAAGFARSAPARLVELGRLGPIEANASLAALDAASARGGRMATPVTAHVIARRR